MNNGAKTVAALLFVAALGVALSLPILQSSDAPASKRAFPPRRTKVAKHPSRTPKPESPSETPSPGQESNRFLTPYPEHCLEAIAAPSGAGLVAAFDGIRVSIVPASGGDTVTARVDPPIAWSASGDVLATGAGKLLTADGQRDGRLFAVAGGQWAWSPVANCAIRASSEGIVASSIHGPDKLLTSISAVDLTISPDGTRIAFVHEADDGSVSLLFGNLRRGTLHEGLPPSQGVTFALHGWAPDGTTVLYSAIEAGSQAARGAPLLGVAQGEGPVAFSGTNAVLPAADAVTTCGSQVVGVVGRKGEVATQNQLALLAAGESPDYLTGSGFAYGSPSCSVDGVLAVAVRSPRDNDGGRERRLVLLQLDDGSESVLSSGGFTDEHAQWADASTAVLFVRRPLGGGRAQVWLLQGSSAQPTGLTLDPAVAYFGSHDWPVVLDWSATAPSGAPSG